MRKILIIGSALAAALFLGSGAFAGSDTRIVDARTKLDVESAFVQLSSSWDQPYLTPKITPADGPLMAAIREEFDALTHERLCSQDRTETATAVPRTVNILMNRASLAYIDPLIDPGNLGATQEKMSSDLRLS